MICEEQRGYSLFGRHTYVSMIAEYFARIARPSRASISPTAPLPEWLSASYFPSAG